ncbi:MAG: hypothetical protein EBY17_27870, partial [Acidobacteriia bacterium]|nr:hypothetical protein [Terriglobia bacterium]
MRISKGRKLEKANRAKDTLEFRQEAVRLVECGKGNCWDNACAETLFGSLKLARLAGRTFTTRHEARDEALEWIHWYNNTR